MKIQIKRAYERSATDDGQRILVDRLWPRGLTKGELKADLWLKDIAPSAELRKWFGHDPKKWPEFQRRYLKELEANTADLAQLRIALGAGPVTLVYGAKDKDHNNAVVLKGFLLKE